MSSSTAAISFQQVQKIFRKGGASLPAFGPVSFDVAPGEFLAILGSSGCGKSTSLNMTAGLMAVSSGSILFGGKPVDGVNTEVGYLTQKDSLLPWRSVADNVALPLEIRHVGRDERAERTRRALEQVGLTGFENHYPAELSGGMRKRVAIARMLILAPGTLLLDEPFAALDPELRGQMQQILMTIWQNDRKTVLFVTHDVVEALKLADRIVVLTERPGRIKAIYQVPLPRPRTLEDIEFAPEFVHAQKEVTQLLRARASSLEAAR